MMTAINVGTCEALRTFERAILRTEASKQEASFDPELVDRGLQDSEQSGESITVDKHGLCLLTLSDQALEQKSQL